MFRVFNLHYLSDDEAQSLLRVLDAEEVEYEVVSEFERAGWVCVEDDDEYTYARDIIDNHLRTKRSNKKKPTAKKPKKAMYVFVAFGALLFLSRYIKEFMSYF